MSSRHFSSGALDALSRFGDIMLPSHEPFPSFSELGCLEHIDSIVDYAPADDIRQLNQLLGVLNWLPDGGLRRVFRWCETPEGWPEMIARNFRLLNFALRSILCTLYYSGKAGTGYEGPTPLDLIGFEICRIPKEVHTRETARP